LRPIEDSVRAPGDNTDPWLDRRGYIDPSKRLFCFPYAGGGTVNFRDWSSAIGPHLEVCAIRLPGRESQRREPLLSRMDAAVEILASVLRRYLDRPFAFFGHSMGALLAYETARRVAAGGRSPRVLFVSGHGAPFMPRRKRLLYNLPRDELIAEIRALGGTPPEVFEDPELVDLVLPKLLADLEMVDTYTELDGPALDCPIVAMAGDQDRDLTREEVAGWRAVTRGPFKTLLFHGGHFYINTARREVLRALKRELTLFDMG
jgi:surfactin synthase thioesterase subunit